MYFATLNVFGICLNGCNVYLHLCVDDIIWMSVQYSREVISGGYAFTNGGASVSSYVSGLVELVDKCKCCKCHWYGKFSRNEAYSIMWNTVSMCMLCMYGQLTAKL